MSPRPEYLRLCRFLDESLHPFYNLAADSLTEETERDLLSALSQVFSQVKQWTNEFDSDEELSAESVDDRACSVSATSYLDNRHCLAKIIGDLMLLLAINIQYAQHLVGNTLVAISKFVLASDRSWDDFMHLLCLCLELAICNSLTSSESDALGTRYLDCDLSTRSFLKLKLKSANWFVVAAIFQVLHNILKYLKQDFDDKVMKTYLDSISSSMLNLPWDVLNEIYLSHNIEAPKGSPKDVLLQRKDIQPREATMFFGNLIQFLCSLVGQCSFLEDGDGFSPVICKIINLVPKLTAWCHSELQTTHHDRISHYLRHKTLMLMVKLSSSIHIEQTVLMTWMHLVHMYFEDVLMQPISGVKLDQDGLLDGSPFCTSISDPGKQSMLSRHLQRLTVFLFLKCSLNLASCKRSPGEPQCLCENLKHYWTGELNWDPQCCTKSKGLIELDKWLQAHIPVDISANDEFYFERCVRFTLSFLRLFMHEDDILFEMLLQLFRLPFYLEHQTIKNEPLAEAKDRPLFIASDLFNPINLFHLFLAEIHYDHQVLLDYLISKDTGSSCAEYLLRSLRIVCNSWSLFIKFPGVEEGLNQLCPKRQRVLIDSTDLKDGRISSLEQCNEGHAHGRKGYKNYRLSFVAARDCLVSLRTSINRLNQK
ncbi:uncharacterized protein LOC105177755, partial [Sesamum indicum]|uniref:Uncharacterized protein LOC105177755 n=1 Tax=Sesamum indicum TaxID=4182 RepID=A0A6I9UDQ1_SESIN